MGYATLGLIVHDTVNTNFQTGAGNINVLDARHIVSPSVSGLVGTGLIRSAHTLRCRDSVTNVRLCR